MINMYRDIQDTGYKPIEFRDVLAYLYQISEKGIEKISGFELFVKTQNTMKSSTLPLEYIINKLETEYNHHLQFKEIITQLEQTDVLTPEENIYLINSDELENAIERHNTKISTLEKYMIPKEWQGKGVTS